MELIFAIFNLKKVLKTLKNSIVRAKLLAKNLFYKKRDRQNDGVYYIVGGFVLILIIIQSGYLFWQHNGSNDALSGEGTNVRELGEFIISSIQKDSLERYNKEIQGTNDFGFESTQYQSAKGVVTKNAEALISPEQFHGGKQSLKIDWKKGQSKSVRLNNYLATQKDRYYKLGFWISSSHNRSLRVMLNNGSQSMQVAEVGIMSNQENKFRYYEYNFKAPLEASNLELSIDGESGVIFIDDIRLLSLSLEKDTDLSLIKSTINGNDQTFFAGAKQDLHEENSDALSHANALLGQVFSAQGVDLVEVSFFITRNGDGGIGDYFLELREFNEKDQTISLEKIAVKSFSSKDIKSSAENQFDIFAKLEVDKKYWVGVSNRGVNVNKDNYLSLGQAKNNLAYSGGDGFLIYGENKFFTEEKDLYFATKFNKSFRLGEKNVCYGETVYDLGKNKSRLDYQLNSVSGSNILDIYKKQNISTDKWKNITINDKDSYLVYKIEAGEKNIDKFVVSNVIFHNNIRLSVSIDGVQWSEVFSENPGAQWQSSGRVEIKLKNKAKRIYIKFKKNGEGSSVFVGGYFVFDLTD